MYSPAASAELYPDPLDDEIPDPAALPSDCPAVLALPAILNMPFATARPQALPTFCIVEIADERVEIVWPAIFVACPVELWIPTEPNALARDSPQAVPETPNTEAYPEATDAAEDAAPIAAEDINPEPELIPAATEDIMDNPAD